LVKFNLSKSREKRAAGGSLRGEELRSASCNSIEDLTIAETAIKGRVDGNLLSTEMPDTGTDLRQNGKNSRENRRPW